MIILFLIFVCAILGFYSWLFRDLAIESKEFQKKIKQSIIHSNNFFEIQTKCQNCKGTNWISFPKGTQLNDKSLMALNCIHCKYIGKHIQVIPA